MVCNVTLSIVSQTLCGLCEPDLLVCCVSDLVGGVQSVTLGDEEANRRGTQKSILERRGPPTFPIVIEMRERMMWVAHDTQASVDALLLNKVPLVQVG